MDKPKEDYKKALEDLLHELLGCDGHPCRICCGAIDYVKDGLTAIQSLRQEIDYLRDYTEEREDDIYEDE